jgi:hypothetical protein
VASETSKHLYDRNKAVYELLRYGVKVSPGAGENNVTVWLIDWKNPQNIDFAIAEEVTVKGADLASAAKASSKRPDVVIYVNGIALGLLEPTRSKESVAEGIRQNLDNQKKELIQPFFSTMQFGRVWFNLELVRAPPPCLEYLVAHELAHLIERRHSDRFTAVLDRHLPTWRQLREMLGLLPLSYLPVVRR